jgi:hypothetical protein
MVLERGNEELVGREVPQELKLRTVSGEEINAVGD